MPDRYTDPLLSEPSTSSFDPARSVAPLDSRSGDDGASPLGQANTGPRWQALGELGVGGMGRVVLARDGWLDRDVAIKEPRSEADVRHLAREAAVTARLEHPGVVPVYDIGHSADGRPWFAMRVVRGRALDAQLAEAPTAEARTPLLRRMLAACEAVAFAHDRGIVHRDLKPSNIMLGAFGETLVIDWGLARAPDLPDALSYRAGTPRYTSPEQARGEPAGPEADVFALGVILFEVATGRAAFPQRDGPAILAELRAGRVPLEVLDGNVPPELAAIIRRAMAPLPGARYRDGKALADDLGRYLDGARVAAHTYSTFELVRRVARAWRAPLLVAALAALVLVGVLVVSFAAMRADKERAEESLALALGGAAGRALDHENRAEAEILAAHALARAPLPESRGVLSSLPLPRPTVDVLGVVPCHPVDLAGARVLCRTDDGFGVADGGFLRWRAPYEPDRGIALLDHGRAVAAVGNEVAIFDAETGERRATFPLECGATRTLRPADDGVSALTQSDRCGARVRVDGVVRIPAPCASGTLGTVSVDRHGARWAASCLDGTISVGRFDDAGAPLQVAGVGPGREAQVTAIAFVGDADRLVFGTRTGTVRAMDLATREVIEVVTGEGFLHRIGVDAAGRRAFLVRDQGAPMVIDLDASAPLGRLSDEPWGAIAFEPDGRIIAASSRLERWDFTGVAPRMLHFPAGLDRIAVAPDGERVAIAHDATVTVVETNSRGVVGHVRWQDGFVKTLSFSQDGRTLHAHGFGEQTVVDIANDRSLEIVHRTPLLANLRRLGVLADGSLLGSEYRFALHRYGLGAPVTIPPTAMLDLAVGGEGRSVAALGEDLHIYRAIDFVADPRLVDCGPDRSARAVALDPSGRVFVVEPDAIEPRCAGADGEVGYAVEGGDLLAAAVTDRWVAAGGRDGAVHLWRRGEPEVFAVYRSHVGRAAAVAIDPRGRWLASAGWDGRLGFYTLPPPETVDPATIEAAWSRVLSQTIDLRAASRGPRR